ncbi:hypothetical protein CEK25_003652 [Fusarium fujikuroi]|nr:hypothetical protein CEK25_003652 [Fusarium fujikuroi]
MPPLWNRPPLWYPQDMDVHLKTWKASTSRRGRPLGTDSREEIILGRPPGIFIRGPAGILMDGPARNKCLRQPEVWNKIRGRKCLKEAVLWKS